MSFQAINCTRTKLTQPTEFMQKKQNTQKTNHNTNTLAKKMCKIHQKLYLNQHQSVRTAHTCVCTIMLHSTAEYSSNDLHSYPPEHHHCLLIYWTEGCTNKLTTTKRNTKKTK